MHMRMHMAVRSAAEPRALSLRYHDGHTRCDGPAGSSCRGYLEATYTYAMGARYFLNHEPSGEPPYTALDYGKPSGQFALDLVHEVLIEYHKDALETLSKTVGYNATARVQKMKPTGALLSYWGPQVLSTAMRIVLCMGPNLPPLIVSATAPLICLVYPISARR